MSYYDQVQEAAAAIRARVPQMPEIAVVLGSGLGDFAGSLRDAVTMPYGDLPHWPASRVVGHQGKLVVGTVGGRTVVALAGRSHLYEGHDALTVSFAVRVLGMLGVKTLILTNAAGGINIELAQGALMVISDHLNLMGVNPLRGAHDPRFGERFPDLTETYARDYQELAVEEAHAMGLDLRRGVYAALSGPTYETPAEIRMLRTLGADAVGMSTVPEAVAARQMGMKVLGISCITNMAAGVVGEPIVHQEVIETGERVRDTFRELLRRVIPRLQ